MRNLLHTILLKPCSVSVFSSSLSLWVVCNSRARFAPPTLSLACWSVGYETKEGLSATQPIGIVSCFLNSASTSSLPFAIQCFYIFDAIHILQRPPSIPLSLSVFSLYLPLSLLISNEFGAPRIGGWDSLSGCGLHGAEGG